MCPGLLVRRTLSISSFLIELALGDKKGGRGEGEPEV